MVVPCTCRHVIAPPIHGLLGLVIPGAIIGDTAILDAVVVSPLIHGVAGDVRTILPPLVALFHYLLLQRASRCKSV